MALNSACSESHMASIVVLQLRPTVTENVARCFPLVASLGRGPALDAYMRMQLIDLHSRVEPSSPDTLLLAEMSIKASLDNT